NWLIDHWLRVTNIDLVCCFDVPKGGKSRSKSKRTKDGAGASGQGGADGANPSVVLPNPSIGVDSTTGLPLARIIPTEVHGGLVEQQQKAAEETRQQLEQAELARQLQEQAEEAARQLQDDMEAEGESSHAGDQGGRGIGAANGGANQGNQLVEPTMKEVLDAIRLMGSQMLAMTQVITPLVNSSVGQAPQVQVVVPGAAGQVAPVDEVIELDPPARRSGKVDYLKVLEHISRLGTKHFAGSADPMEADEWRDRLARNFKSTRCPEEYQRDIAVHFLEGDAHNWWLSVDKRTNGSIEKFSDFEVEFNHKYFPAEAWDRLEAKFLDLTQGRRSVREYEEEFNRLRKYVGKELEDEKVQVRRFIRGLRVELRTYCSVRTFRTVSELVERMAMLETNLAEEARLKSRSQASGTGHAGDRKRKRDSSDEGKTSGGRPECQKCGRRHGGECWRAMGACTRCGKMDHSVRDCPGPDQSRGQAAGGDSRTCFQCGKAGHFRKDCPKLQAGSGRMRSEVSKPEPSRGQTSAPRVYELSKDTDEAKPFMAITGNDLILFFLNF
ncbi:uncharacterized protein LOC130502277, partial [Raphanus sativus]